jgi:hypothetical protein
MGFILLLASYVVCIIATLIGWHAFKKFDSGQSWNYRLPFFLKLSDEELRAIKERGEGCDHCHCQIDWDEEGGHIYGDGSVLCAQCEAEEALMNCDWCNRYVNDGDGRYRGAAGEYRLCPNCELRYDEGAR